MHTCIPIPSEETVALAVWWFGGLPVWRLDDLVKVCQGLVLWWFGDLEVWQVSPTMVRIERRLVQKGPAKVASARRGTLSQNGYGGIWAAPKHANRECTSVKHASEGMWRRREYAVCESVLLETMCF